MYLLKFIILMCFFIVLLVSGIISLNSIINISEAVEWIQQNWIIALLALIASISLLWIGRKLIKGMIIIAGAGLTMYYAITYGPGIYEVLEPYGFLNFGFLVLLSPLLSEKVRDLLSDWNDELEYRAESKNKSKQNQQTILQQSSTSQMDSIKENSFETYVKEMEHRTIQNSATIKYNYFAKHYGNIGFGESGANEFVGAALFAKYRPAFEKDIDYGIEQVFKRHFSPLQFSDYMDEIINRSDVPYATWSAVYNYLKNNVQWIKNHEVYGNQAGISPVVSEALSGMQSLSNKNHQAKSIVKAQSFELFVTQLEHRKIQEITLTKYNHFAKQYGNVSFGEYGAYEFMAAALFAKYRPAFGKYINDGIEKVFKRKFSPLQFNEYLTDIVNRSDIGYSNYNGVYNYLKNNVSWMKSHPLQGYQSVIPSPVSEGLSGTHSTSKKDHNQPLKNIFQVVGVTFDNRQAVIKKLQKGDSLFLVLEPTNPHDKNAIHVMNQSNQSVGYISKKENQELIGSFNGKNVMRAWVDQVYSGSSKADYFGVQIQIDKSPQPQVYSGSSNNRTDTLHREVLERNRLLEEFNLKRDHPSRPTNVNNIRRETILNHEPKIQRAPKEILPKSDTKTTSPNRDQEIIKRLRKLKEKYSNYQGGIPVQYFNIVTLHKEVLERNGLLEEFNLKGDINSHLPM